MSVHAVQDKESQHDGCVTTEPLDSPGGDLECSSHNPFRRLDWRWRRASLSPAPTTARGRRLDDLWVHRARRYLAALDGGRLPASMAAGIAAAQRLRSPECSDARQELEVRLLAGQDDATVSVRTGLDRVVVAAYEALFFDVRALLPHSDALLSLAIGRRLYEPDGGGAWATLRLLAYYGGSHVIDALLGRRGDPEAADDEGPDPAAVRQFERLLRVNAQQAKQIDALRLIRLWAYEGRVRAIALPEPVVAPRSVPQPDLSALKAATLRPATSDATPRLGVAG